MEEITKNASRGDLIPVLLGLSQKTMENAKLLHQKCDSISHVFCGIVPFPLRFSIYMKFHRVGHTRGERLMLQALLDFSDQFENRDTILYLIPCTKEYVEMILKNRKILESRFVIALPSHPTRENSTPRGAES